MLIATDHGGILCWCCCCCCCCFRYYKDNDGLSLDVGPFTAALVSAKAISQSAAAAAAVAATAAAAV
jgi:hypothetical protein